MCKLHPLLHPGTHQTARALAAAHLDVYEAAARAVTEFEWLLARAAGYEPASSLARACANLTRDVTAVQVSTARWVLDL
jgi:hypothetical protein